MIQHLDELLELAGKTKKMKLAVAAAQDEDVLKAVCEAAKLNIIEPVLYGDLSEIREIARKIEMNIDSVEMHHCSDVKEAAAQAVDAVSSGSADFLMKGLVDTSILLKAVLKKDAGLRTERLLSHVMVYSPKTYHKLLMLTDGGMNIAPNLQEKKEILMNAVEVAKALGAEPVKVACLAAKEKVDEKMEATIDAAKLVEEQKKGVFGENVIVEGPMAFDLAISKEASRIKKFNSPVAGEADVLLVPNIEMGNGIGKTMTYMAQAESAGIIMGARIPIVLVSRADEFKTKLNSIALGSMIAMCK
ncbi:MAG: bifunctional enoyl-CoA hydratase/phosphate acetyltransferase [Tindallia sp. MSAO_Bac2]|nr:MAG: bifunctional enoyl-CoA hydratase/phosphate acetyltransferase [Tindallia sp. MSAO_Bac2]